MPNKTLTRSNYESVVYEAVVIDILNNSRTEYLAVYHALLKIFEDICVLVEQGAKAEVARNSIQKTFEPSL